MANTAGRKAGDPKAIAGKVKAGEIVDESLGFSSPNWRTDTAEVALTFKAPATVTTAWKDD